MLMAKQQIQMVGRGKIIKPNPQFDSEVWRDIKTRVDLMRADNPIHRVTYQQLLDARMRFFTICPLELDKKILTIFGDPATREAFHSELVKMGEALLEALRQFDRRAPR